MSSKKQGRVALAIGTCPVGDRDVSLLGAFQFSPMVSLSPSAEVRYLAAEVACLLQGEDEGAHNSVGALLVVGAMACIGLEVLHETSVGIKADAFVIALQLDGLALAGLALILEGEEIAVAAEAEHALDGVGKVERAALARAEHGARLLVGPFDSKFNGIGIANLVDVED